MRARFMLLLSCAVFTGAIEARTVIGSKKFTEGIILGEILQQLVAARGIDSEHRRELGGTRILWEAMLRKDIDAYVEYTGTLRFEILRDSNLKTWDDLKLALAQRGIGITKSLGFEDTYSLGITRKRARELGIETMSDLTRHQELTYGLSHEFLERQDGWPGLSMRYGIRGKSVRGVDHDIGYRGIQSGAIDVIDLYTTDAEISYYDLVALKDDLNYFPGYEAVVVYRLDSDPGFASLLDELTGKIHADQMIEMNADVKLHGKSVQIVAQTFLGKHLKIQSAIQQESLMQSILNRTWEHLLLVVIPLLCGILFSVPLGYFASKNTARGGIILSIVGVIQTIPSLALLVFMIPLLGIGTLPALVALFLYSLLPIVRGTFLGFSSIPEWVHESAESLGMTPWFKLRKIDWPLALRSVLSGIKTSAVIGVGVATLGALIGAGGYGQTILKGIRLDDTTLILSGAIPAALMALVVQGLFDVLERLLVSKGLQSQKS
ncbi:MAG: ABC transporter permease subunit [Spirochaetia bacterium]|nr:ABC transporter permease subunit [Spirochaetia bacterium]